MPEPHFDTRWGSKGSRNSLDFHLRMRAVNSDVNARIKKTLLLAEAVALESLRWGVPSGEASENPGHVHLRDTIRSTGIKYRPGGAGGGGHYEIVVSVGHRTLTPQLKFVLGGTGLFNREGSTGRIFAGGGNFANLTEARMNLGGNIPMPMSGGMQVGTGNKIYRMYQRGQHPNRGWLELAQAKTRTVLRRGIDAIGNS